MRPSRLSSSDWLVFAAILAGLALRFFNLAGIPPVVGQDEAVNGYDAYSLFLTGRDHHGHPFPLAGLESFGDWVSPLLTFLTAPFVGWFGLNQGVVRAVPASIGVLLIPVLYLLTFELFGRRWVAALAAWLVAVSPLLVLLSRRAIPPSLVPTMVSLTMLVAVWSARRRSRIGFLFSAACAGLTVISYPAMKLYVPLLGALGLLIYRKDYVGLERSTLLHAAALFLALAGPSLYLSTVDPGGRARFEQVSALDRLNSDPLLLARQYASYFSPRFLFLAGDEQLKHVPAGVGVEPRSEALLLLAGLGWLILVATKPPDQLDRRAAVLLLGALALAPLAASLTRPSPDVMRAAAMLPLLSVTMAAGAGALADIALELSRKPRPPIVRGVLGVMALAYVAVVGWEVSSQQRQYFGDYSRQTLGDFYVGLEQALGYIRAHDSEYDTVLISSDPFVYMFVLFYARWSPSDVHQHLAVRREPPKLNTALSLGKYRFRSADFRLRGVEEVYSFAVPSGPTWRVYAGETRDFGRVLWLPPPS